jgi:hypothetical protein
VSASPARLARWLAVLVLPLAVACGGGGETAPASPTPQQGAAASVTPPPATPTPPPWPVARELPERAGARISTDNLNVRVQPSTNAAVVGLLQPGDDVAIAGRSADSQWLAIVNTGWVAHRAQWMTLTVDFRSLPEVGTRDLVPPAHPPGASSGYPAVDVVVEAALAQDLPRLRALAETLSIQCQQAPGMGGPPPCSVQPGATPGTAVEVFPTSVCEGEHVLAANILQVLERLYQSGNAKNAPLRLYAVIEASRQQSTFFPEGRWIAILALPDGTGRALAINEKGLVRVDLGCNQPAVEMLQRRPFETPVYVLPPLATPPVHPRP